MLGKFHSTVRSSQPNATEKIVALPRTAPKTFPMSARPDARFASDNTAGLCPEALAALTAANSGSAPSYGSDPTTARAQDLFRQIFETDCETFFVFNGTAANALALSALCQRHQSVLCHEVAHIDTDECGAPEFFTGGSKLLPLTGPAAKLTPTTVASALTRGHGVHFPKPGALSLTQSTEHGTLYAPAEIRALADLAHMRLLYEGHPVYGGWVDRLARRLDPGAIPAGEIEEESP
jgi:threonine aldolase